MSAGYRTAGGSDGIYLAGHSIHRAGESTGAVPLSHRRAGRRGHLTAEPARVGLRPSADASA